MTDPGTSPGGGGGGTSSGLDTAEKKELLAGFDLRSFLADSLENVENPENVKWNDGDIAAAASLLGNSSGRELSFTVSFENEPYNGSVVSGTVGYVLSVTDGAVNGYKASTSDDAGLEVDGYKLTVAMNEMVTAYGTVSVSGGKAEFTDLEAIPVPVGTDISVSLEGEEIDLDELFVDIPKRHAEYEDIPKDLYTIMQGMGNLTMYVAQGISSPVEGYYDLSDLSRTSADPDAFRSYVRFSDYEYQEGQYQLTMTEVHAEGPLNIRYNDQTIYYSGILDVDMETPNFGTTFDNFAATIVPDAGDVEMTDPVNGTYVSNLASFADSPEFSAEIEISDRIYENDEYIAMGTVNVLNMFLCTLNDEWLIPDSENSAAGRLYIGEAGFSSAIEGRYTKETGGTISITEGCVKPVAGYEFTFSATIKPLASAAGYYVYSLQDFTFEECEYNEEQIGYLNALSSMTGGMYY